MIKHTIGDIATGTTYQGEYDPPEKCPSCGAETLKAGALRFEANIPTASYFCTNCNGPLGSFEVTASGRFRP